ncbi:hypothetical protein [Bdellovibrio sp. KM01]|uniref:hypothetical protein n=1 Tax=Bdellovibrio sp. KM01 TaxID=2748865 RepID=UPI0015EA403F|nr:hypothetical protein [Bdellovibrio sp. KM01]QLY26317.1 hypothetical protein HW988_04615 [Bdellovibrio sp. KM01]
MMIRVLLGLLVLGMSFVAHAEDYCDKYFQETGLVQKGQNLLNLVKTSRVISEEPNVPPGMWGIQYIMSEDDIGKTVLTEKDSSGKCIPTRVYVGKDPKNVSLDLVTCKRLDNFFRDHGKDVKKCGAMATELAQLFEGSPWKAENPDFTAGEVWGACQGNNTFMKMVKDPKVGAFLAQKVKNEKASSQKAKTVKGVGTR